MLYDILPYQTRVMLIFKKSSFVDQLFVIKLTNKINLFFNQKNTLWPLKSVTNIENLSKYILDMGYL